MLFPSTTGCASAAQPCLFQEPFPETLGSSGRAAKSSEGEISLPKSPDRADLGAGELGKSPVSAVQPGMHAAATSFPRGFISLNFPWQRCPPGACRVLARPEHSCRGCCQVLAIPFLCTSRGAMQIFAQCKAFFMSPSTSLKLELAASL